MRRPFWGWLGAAGLTLALAVSGCTGTEGVAGVAEQRDRSGLPVEDTVVEDPVPGPLEVDDPGADPLGGEEPAPELPGSDPTG